MATWIKAGFWENLCKPCKGYKGWLNLDEFVASKAGGGDGYTYLEIPIDSATLITPPALILPGAGNVGEGVLLLPELFTGSGKYYEWKLVLEFYPGSTPYTGGGTIGVSSEVGGYPSFNVANISQNQESVWQTSSESPGSPTNQEPELLNIHLKLTWGSGTFVGGDGTMKAKIWYKIVNFG